MNRSLICSVCRRIVPPAGRHQLNQRCGEKMAQDDPGCDGIMRDVVVDRLETLMRESWLIAAIERLAKK